MLSQKKYQINNLTYYFLLLLLFFNSLLLSQEKKIHFEVLSNPDIKDAWWLEKNNFGIKPNGTDFRLKWNAERQKIEYAFDVISQKDGSYLRESFIKYSFSDKTFLRAGKYYRDFSNYLNDELSSGHMLISKNSQPMPKIGFITSKYVKRNESLNFDFGISHAIFDKNKFYNRPPMLHEKFLYMNINKKNYEFSIGFVHEAMWGGSTIDSGSQPDNFSDFLRVLIAEDSKKEDYDSMPSDPGWHPNAIGNHLGIWDISLKKRNKSKVAMLYYQHFFEDTSGLRFANKWDGLWGIELINYIKKTNILFEYIDTTNQNINPPYVNDAYYNHTVYTGGWSYKDYTIGNPFLTHNGINPSKVIHIGASGPILNKYFYTFKAARKINTTDFIKYYLAVKKEISRNYILNFLVFNNDKEIGVGLSFSKIL